MTLEYLQYPAVRQYALTGDQDAKRSAIELLARETFLDRRGAEAAIEYVRRVCASMSATERDGFFHALQPPARPTLAEAFLSALYLDRLTAWLSALLEKADRATRRR